MGLNVHRIRKIFCNQRVCIVYSWFSLFLWQRRFSHALTYFISLLDPAVSIVRIHFFCEDRHIRNSRPEVFYKKDVLKNLVKFKGKHLVYSLFFNKVQAFGTDVFLRILRNFLKQVFWSKLLEDCSKIPIRY